MVQVFAIQWNPCQTKTSQETEKNLRKFTETIAEAKSYSYVQFAIISVRGVSWSEVTTVPKRKSHRGLDLDLSLNSEVNIRKGWKEKGGTK